MEVRKKLVVISGSWSFSHSIEFKMAAILAIYGYFYGKLRKTRNVTSHGPRNFLPKTLLYQIFPFALLWEYVPIQNYVKNRPSTFFEGGRGSFLVQNGRFFIILPIFQRIHYIWRVKSSYMMNSSWNMIKNRPDTLLITSKYILELHNDEKICKN